MAIFLEFYTFPKGKERFSRAVKMFSFLMVFMMLAGTGQVAALVSYDNDPPMFWKEIDNPPS